MKRILFFVHYNKYNGLEEYVLYLLQHIKHIYTRIVFISNSPLSEEHKNKLSGLYHSLIIRKNKGFDFGAWKDALLTEGWDALAEYDNVTLMNDTCFGPLFDLEKIYIDMESQAIDFWGISWHGKKKSGMPGTNGPIPEHLQSYFMCFNNAVILSEAFRKFWKSVKYQNEVVKVIQLYESRLTPILSRNGFKYGVAYERNIKNVITHKNISFFLPDIIIKNKMPFIKIKSFINFPYPQYIIDLIQKTTNYPVDLIFKYAAKMFDPALLLQIFNKQVPAIPITEYNATLSIAIHLHVFYIDIFEKYLCLFNTIAFSFDLYITTDTTDKEEQIKTLLKNTQTERKLVKIVVAENRGRDILPWLNLSDELGRYDVIGHFHTKKTTFLNDWVGVTWLQDILELLLVPINRIIKEFSDNPKLGIIIPDIPVYYQLKPVLIDTTKDNNRYCYLLNQLWNRLNTTKKINFNELKTIIMPYGNMFWYRPAALQSLTNLHLSRDDFDAEPLANDATLAHFIERLPVYCAWDKGFDYRIMVSVPPKINSFIDHMVISDIHNAKLKSKAYRLGNFFLLIPKKIRRAFLNKD